MTTETCGYLIRQLDIAWKLASHHLDGLTTEECLWRPASAGLHLHQAHGSWVADWPTRESYDMGPPSIGWLTWHMGLWWSMALDHSFGPAQLSRDEVIWPGDAEGVRTWLGDLHRRWRTELERMNDDDLRSTERTRWPFRNRPFGDVVAWVNVELTKNAAELGYARFLYGAPGRREG